MIKICTTPFDIAERFVGVHEIPGPDDHPLIKWMISLCAPWMKEVHDEIAWCSAFVHAPAYLLQLDRWDRLNARGWLSVGQSIELRDANVGFDVIVLQRGSEPQPGPEIINAPGHVGYFAGYDGGNEVEILGGNQGNAVNRRRFPVEKILGVRRIPPFPV